MYLTYLWYLHHTVVFWGVSASRALPNLCRYHTVPTDTPRYKKCILTRDYYSRIEIGSTMVLQWYVFSASFRKIRRPRSQQPPAIVKVDDISSCLWPSIGRHIIYCSVVGASSGRDVLDRLSRSRSSSSLSASVAMAMEAEVAEPRRGYPRRCGGDRRCPVLQAVH